jgi:hypothetical protein
MLDRDNAECGRCADERRMPWYEAPEQSQSPPLDGG